MRFTAKQERTKTERKRLVREVESDARTHITTKRSYNANEKPLSVTMKSKPRAFHFVFHEKHQFNVKQLQQKWQSTKLYEPRMIEPKIYGIGVTYH